MTSSDPPVEGSETQTQGPCEAQRLLEETFRERFTEADADYMTEVATPLPDPPSVTNWYSRPKRTFDYSRGDRGRGGGRGDWRGGHSNHRDNRDRYRDNRANRDGGDGNRDGNRDGGYGNRDGRYGNRDSNRDGGYRNRDGGHGNRDGGHGNRDGGHGNRDGGHGNRDGNWASERGRGRAHYAGMRNADGSHDDRPPRRNHPYQRSDNSREWT